MNLSALQFLGKGGEQITPSTVETRDAVSTAELHHVVDVNESAWCRPCQCTDCAHAERVERVLTAAGLGRGESTARELPQVARITRYGAMGETIAGCWFENGARLRYHEQDDGHVSQVVFAPEDPRTPAATSPKPEAESAEMGLVSTLAAYSDYRRSKDFDGLRREYPELALVVGTDMD